MLKWIFGFAAVTTFIGTAAFLRVRRQRVRKRALSHAIETLANRLVSNATIPERYRNLVAKQIVHFYALARENDDRPHSSRVLLHMAKHPCVRKHIANDLKNKKEQLKSTDPTTLKHLVSNIAWMLVLGFDRLYDRELVYDAQIQDYVDITEHRLSYCRPWLDANALNRTTLLLDPRERNNAITAAASVGGEV